MPPPSCRVGRANKSPVSGAKARQEDGKCIAAVLGSSLIATARVGEDVDERESYYEGHADCPTFWLAGCAGAGARSCAEHESEYEGHADCSTLWLAGCEARVRARVRTCIWGLAFAIVFALDITVALSFIIVLVFAIMLVVACVCVRAVSSALSPSCVGFLPHRSIIFETRFSSSRFPHPV